MSIAEVPVSDAVGTWVHLRVYGSDRRRAVKQAKREARQHGFRVVEVASAVAQDDGTWSVELGVRA